MIVIVISWIVISFVLFTFGDFFILLYNKACKRQENYSFIDTFLLGLFFTLIPLSISSFWLPSNHYVLYSYLAICIVYWVVRRERLIYLFRHFKKQFSDLSLAHKLVLIAGLVTFVLMALWTPTGFDSTSYHHAHIRWNEDYPVIPGIGNLEDRYGFNSNYFLISAVFTFRNFLGYPVCALQALVVAYACCWVLLEVVRSKFELKRVGLLLLFILLFYYTNKVIGDTYTDVLPSAVIFYIFAKLILYKGSFNRDILFYIFVPVALVPFKLSVMPFALLSLFLLIYILKEKKYRPAVFTCISLFILFFVWFARTVIISGYLVYPLYELDLFSFDWKIPVEIAERQRGLIKYYSGFGGILKGVFEYHQKYYFILVFIYFVTIISLIYSSFKVYKLKDRVYTSIFFTVLACMGYWLFSAPDFRFGCGFIFSAVFLGWALLLGNRKYSEIWLGKLFSYALILWMFTFSVRSASYYWEYLETHEPTNTNRIARLIATPYSIKDKMQLVKEEEKPVENYAFTPYPLGYDVYIYVSSYPLWCFDIVPCVPERGLGLDIWTGRNVESIELRSTTIRDGFRTKPGFKDVYNK